MKKIFTAIIVLIIILLCGCDPYINKQPDSYGEYVWICNEPYIVYSVNYNSVDNAKTVIEDEEISFTLGFQANRVEAWIAKEKNGEIVDCKTLFSGTCKYSKTKFTIKVDTDSDILFNGKYEKLVFVREEE